MQPATIVLVFVILWWLSFFIVLPFGHVSQDDVGEVEPGTVSSAPHKFPWRKKALITTGVASVLTIIVYSVVTYNLLGINWAS